MSCESPWIASSLSYPVVEKPDNVAHGPGSVVPVRSFQSSARFSACFLLECGCYGESIGNSYRLQVARTGVIAEKAAKCIYIPSLGQSLYFARLSAMHPRCLQHLELLFDRIQNELVLLEVTHRQRARHHDNGYQVKFSMCFRFLTIKYGSDEENQKV